MIAECARKNRKMGRSVETPKVDIFRMKGGKIVEFFELCDTVKSLAASKNDRT